MRVVTIAALDETNIDAVPVGTRELGALSGMASVAKGRLRRVKQEVRLGCVMRRMAANTADAVSGMGCAGEIGVFQARLVAL